jgi:pimeloyl-ACP methyl ester carboxylesterase
MKTAKILSGNTYFKNYEFDCQLVRSLGKISQGGGDYGEIMSCAFRIKDGNFDSWYEEWFNLAVRINRIADECKSKGHTISAKDAYLRASEYFRQAEWFMRDDLNDPRINELCDHIRRSFQACAKFLPSEIRSIEIPFESNKLHGYFCKTQEKKASVPTILLPSGYDSYVEESYFTARALLERGYNVLMFDGPGQGQTIRREKLFMRHDWENVIPSVYRYAIEECGADKKKIVMIGRSFGGFLAARAASSDCHFAALVCDPGSWDLFALLKEKIPSEIMDKILKFQDEEVNKYFLENVFTNKDKQFFFNWRIKVHGLNTVCEWVRDMEAYTLENVVNKIKCPSLICSAIGEDKSPGSAKKIYENLQCEKHYLEFSAESGGGDHCEAGAPMLWNQEIGDFLDECVF